MYDIYVNVERERILYSSGQIPVIERKVCVQVYSPKMKLLLCEIRRVADEAEAQKWEALQDRLAGGRQ